MPDEDGAGGPHPWGAARGDVLGATRAEVSVGLSGDPSDGHAPRRRKGRAGPWVALSVLTAGSLAGGLMASLSAGTGVPGAGMTPVAFLASSAHDTLTQRTAEVVIGGSVSAGGTVVPISGSGKADFIDNTFSATMSFAASGSTMVERELVIGSTLYMGMTIDGNNVSQITGGPEWIAMPSPDQSASTGPGLGSVDPLSGMQLMVRKGASVRHLGSGTVDGDVVSGYAVTPSRMEVFENIEREIASGQIPQSEVPQILNESKALGPFTDDVWVDGTGLLRRETTHVGGGTSGVSGTVSLTFINYGTSVTIEPPAPSDVVGYQQFMADIQALNSTVV